MTTTIDSLVVELGLDTSKFTKGQNDALNRLRGLEENSHRTAVGVESSAKRMGAAFGGVKSQILELFAAYTGGRGFVSLITDLAEGDAAIGKVSRATGVSIKTLSKWGEIARITGGDAKQMAADFTKWSDIFSAIQSGGPEGPGPLAIVRQIQTVATELDRAHAKIMDPAKGKHQFLLDLADNLKIIHDLHPDNNRAAYLAKHAGIGPDLFDNLSRGAGEMQKLLDLVERIGLATNDSVDAATELGRRWQGIFVHSDAKGREVGLIPNILAASDELNKPVGQVGGEVMDELKRRYKERGLFGAWWDALTFQGEAPSDGKKIYKNLYGNPSGGSLSDGSQPSSSSNSASGTQSFGNSKGERNNNRGNIEYGQFAIDHGAIGSDGRFAKFRTMADGDSAQLALLKTKGYQNLTPVQFAGRYAEGDPNWAKTVAATLGIGLGDIVNTSDPRLPDAIRRAEGTNGAHSRNYAHGYATSSNTSTSTSSVVISGPITINAGQNASATDIASKLREWSIQAALDGNKSTVGSQ